MIRLIPETNINFIQGRRFTYILSGLLFLLSLLFILFRGLNYGIDFSGGTVLHLSFQEPVKTEEVRSILEAMGVKSAVVQKYAEGYEFIVKIGPAAYQKSPSFSSDLLAELKNRFPNSQPEILKEETVGPRIGKELQRNTLIALFLGIIGILIYVSFRFDFRFGTGAVLALIHDAVITTGFVSFLQIPVNIPVVAALLTIIGYSVNDSIVVSDRVRENLKKMRKDNFLTILNRSINETLSRTVLTSLTTILVTVILSIFGAAEIKDFGRIMTFGIIVGTYSSIYIVCAIVFDWQRKSPMR
uniref:Protein-export membrane protein SecF n=1 Tax=candidate division WOR-3 bacterium TaxID=2052148 RepID=A0A7C3UQI4_UNCW3